jgi:PAS domain S-box-containing protein
MTAINQRPVGYNLPQSVMEALGMEGDSALDSDIGDPRTLALLEYSNDLCLVLGADDRVRLASVAFPDELGIDSEQLLDMKFAELVHPDDRATAAHLMAAASGRAGGAARGQFRLILPDGRPWRAHWTMRDATAVPGIAGIVVSGRDVAEIANDSETEFGLRASRELCSFAGRLVHDFNNDCAANLGFARLLLEDMKADDPAREYVGHILSASEHCRSVLDRIRIFSQAGRAALRRESLVQLLERAAINVRVNLSANARLRVTVADEPMEAMVNSASLERLIADLVDNAAFALGDKEGEIAVDLALVRAEGRSWSELRAQSRVDDAAHDILEKVIGNPARSAALARLSISDSAGGMAPEPFAHAFEPLMKSGDGRRRMGLGLATAAVLVKSAGGACVLRSVTGVGTTVEIWLPLAE